MEPTLWRLRNILLLFAMFHLGTCVKFTLIVPKTIYYDSTTVASVTAVDVRSFQEVDLEFRGTINRSVVLNSTRLKFASDGSQAWSVMFTWNQLQQLGENRIQLSMTSSSTQRILFLTVAQNFGYIFIQTDKPLYTPRQTVKFRVIAVDEQQKLATYKIRIDIKNHQQVIVDRKVVTAEEAFSAQKFELPKETSPGLWSITASFEKVDHTLGSNHTVFFEVKEYVLPKFFTLYKIDPQVITAKTQKITINGSATYPYKKPVQGTAGIQIGTWDLTNGIKSIDNHYSMELKNGLFQQEIQLDTLSQMPQDFSKDKRLYVKLNVTEKATAESDVYEDTTTSFSYSDYTVSFDSSKSYFRPGFPYTLQFQVSNLKGRVDTSADMTIKSQFFNSNRLLLEDTQMIKLDQRGKNTTTYNNIPEGTESISFNVSFTDQIGSDGNIHKVTKHASQSNQYMNILYLGVSKRNPCNVTLNYTPYSVTPITPDTITVLVLSKGHIIFTKSTERTHNGSSCIQLPSNLHTEMSPRIRIIAYYYLPAYKEHVIDSLVVNTKHRCVEEIDLHDAAGTGPATISHTGSGLYKPNDIFKLVVTGGKNMRVGLVAVDTAVFHLNNQQTLTRDSMFAQLGSHDTSTVRGDGSSLGEILSNSGLQLMSLIVEEEMKTEQPYFRRDWPLMGSRSSENWPMMGSRSSENRPMGARSSEDRSMMGSRSPENQPMMGSRLSETTRQENSNSNPTAISYEPPQTPTRNDFPESWLFDELQLPSNGIMDLNLTMPDSTTTWSFLAVGLSSNRGICMSHPFNQQVIKLFFADIRLPYKVKRLEEVMLNIIIYNYHTFNLTVTGKITGSAGLCFLANTHGATSFTVVIKPNESVAKSVKVIPLRKGDLSVLVDLKSQHERDIVEKKLHVVAEGQRVKKSITFVLDPEAKHSAIETRRKKKDINLPQLATVNNVYDINKTQQTTINLSLPVEVISGTEFCHISAFGDLMGDIINHSVGEARNLIDARIVDAEEVLGDLAPTVYALLYANLSGLMDEKLKERGRKFVRYGVVRLLKYMRNDTSFALTPTSEPAIWLTAFVLKTLCHASSLAFIDRENLIDKGFNWLLKQVNENGTFNDSSLNWRLAKDSLEYRMMLNAEVLIAILECKRVEKEHHLLLQGIIHSFLNENLEQIKEPMVLAKVTYALMLFDDQSDEYRVALNRLHEIRRKNKQDQMYWSNMIETDESKQIPFWYHKGAQASAIEATAYALIVYVNDGDLNVDAIADWLVGQRNHNGAFIGAMDSTVAIQALSKYSLLKHGVKVDLHCNVSSDRMKEYLFKFTEENATHPESLNNVPVGEVLKVLTRGQGLGQMQVNVEYNVPIEKNKKCTFQIQGQATKAETPSIYDVQRNPICASCKIGCPKIKKRIDNGVRVKVNRAVVMRACKSVGPPFAEGSLCQKLHKNMMKREKKQGEKKEKPKKVVTKYRQTRSIQANQASSKKLICVNVCIQYKKKGASGPIEVKIEMLTGYQPILYDLEQIKQMPDVRLVAYSNTTEELIVHFAKITCKKKTCMTFRASAEASVGRLMPALVEVKEIGAAEPQCAIDYNPPAGEESLQIYCANYSNTNKGECKCLSGLCSQCKKMSLQDVKQLACNSKIVYQLQLKNVTVVDNWEEITARVISINKTGSDNITEGTFIKLTTPKFCTCQTNLYKNSTGSVYLLAGDVEKFVDRKGNSMFRYLLNEESTFLRVTEGFNLENSSTPSVPHYYLETALSPNNKCHK